MLSLAVLSDGEDLIKDLTLPRAQGDQCSCTVTLRQPAEGLNKLCNDSAFSGRARLRRVGLLG